MSWRRLNGQRIPGNIEDAVEAEIRREINRGYDLQVCIGTDSLARTDFIEMATAIVFVRKRNGAFMFIQNRKILQPMSIHQRMLREVSVSIETAYTIVPVLEKYDIPMEIHADINTDTQYASSSAIKEALGYIIGMGYEYKLKPDAFASSSCADKVI